MIDDKAASIVKRLQALKTLRYPHEDVWRDCFEQTYPLRASGFNDERFDASAAQSKKARLLDSTGTDSCRILASGLISGLTPANALWFGMTVANETDDEQRWLDDSSSLLWENIHASNFDAVAYECSLDEVVAGWFAMFIDEDREKGGLRFEQWPISSIYCAASKPGGAIDIVYRPYQLSAEQALQDFGDMLSEGAQKLARDKPDDKVDFVQAIYPRHGYAEGARLARNLPFASCHVELNAKKLVRESGFHEQPVVVPRWLLIPGSVYAVGPVYDSLPDMHELQELCRMELAAAELAIAGMWIAEDDGVLNPRTVKVGPRKIVVANSVDSMKPLLTGADFNVSFTKKEELQRQIRRVLMADQLQPQDGPAMTATEVHTRVNLIRQQLGPIYGRMQAEYLQPLIERCFGLAMRAGIFDPPPESLLNRDYTIRYLSPLARAQQLEEVTAIERLNANVGQIAQVKPEVLDLIDADEEVRYLGEALGVPAKVLKDKKAVERARQERAQAQQQAQQQAMMQPAIEEGSKAMAQRMAAQ